MLVYFFIPIHIPSNYTAMVHIISNGYAPFSPFPCSQGIPGIMKIKDNYNPATWMLEVTSTSVEQKLGVDFARIYQASSLYQ